MQGSSSSSKSAASESMPAFAFPHLNFSQRCKSNDIKASMGITSDGILYTWGSSNALGVLGRKGKASKPLPATFEHSDEKSNNNNPDVRISKCYVGGTKDAGHSAALDVDGNLWLTGCDRWQQLGLGSAAAGAAGYTWKDGKLWQEKFQKNVHLSQLMTQTCEKRGGDVYKKNTLMKGNGEVQGIIRDIAIGGDHTLVLAYNKQDVFSFGRGSEGQLGIVRKPFVSAPIHAKELSMKKTSKEDEAPIAAVCAIRHCSFTLDHEGKVLKKAGKCRLDKDVALHALKLCREKAEADKLLTRDKNKSHI